MARNKYAELAPERKRNKQLRFLRSGMGCLFLVFIPILIPSGFIAYFSVRNHYLRTEEVFTKAIIINDKNYFGNNTRRFSYSYQFLVNGKEYTGNSLNSKYTVGQIVEVKYAASFPLFNEIVKVE